MTQPTQLDPIHPRGFMLCLLPWILGIAAGAAFLVAGAAPAETTSAAASALAPARLAAAITLAWYVFTSARWLIAALRPPNREVVQVYLLPRLVGTALGLAIAYLLNAPWTERILILGLATITLEELARLGLRRHAQPTIHRADAYVAPPSTRRETRMGVGRAILTGITALLFVLAFSFTSWVYLARETVLDAQVWTDNLHTSGLLSALIYTAGDAAQDAAREQRGNARQVAELLTENDVRLAEQWTLPEPWTTTWLQESLAATLAWMQTASTQRVPPISLPVSDVERHVKDAASLLLDRHLATLPTCTPAMGANAYCRPEWMSIDTFAATYKPQNMAIADEVLDLVPDELDLSTAVALYGRPFREPLNVLDRARSALQTLNQGLAWAGTFCLALLALLWWLSSVTWNSRLRWLGAVLLATALIAWTTSYAALSLLPDRLAAPANWELPSSLSITVQEFVRTMLDTVHSRSTVGALVMAGLGLLLLWTPLLAPHREAWTRPANAAARTGVILLALTSILWTLYARAGEQLYTRASQLYRDQDVAAAHTLYCQIDRLYPFRVTGYTGAGQAGATFVDRARRDRYASRLYLDAQAAYEAGEWKTAVQHDEALLLTQPALALRDSVQARLAQALVQWARSFKATGQYERALDRYRFVRDEGLGRGRQLEGQPIRIHHWIGTLYLEWGDELVSQDPEAALATYRRALLDTDDPGVWALAEERMVDAYCTWSRQLYEAGDGRRAAAICIELEAEFPALASGPCAACTP